MKSTRILIVFLTSILMTLAHKMGAPFYECGPHGRFEYCINGIPGCIVGCHCHPGYYFDTDSKICEANTNLRLSFRRQYSMEEPSPTPTTTSRLSPTPTPSNVIDKNVDAITKDVDDLGDWLYNQFFKTIESQVINKTGDEKAPTRRSGTAPGTSTKEPIPPLAISRRSRRKHGKRASRRSKRKRSKKGLRKKLLRISEDDSLFASSSDSSESDSSSTSSESNSDEEEEIENESRDHEGRKIILFNRKPAPPLPSFIFMPNMETPYFPPLGLPAPPVLPMYPMIPVPPMMMMSSSQATTAASQTTPAPHSEPPQTTTEAAHTTQAPETTQEAKTDPPGGDDSPPDADPSTGRKFRKGTARDKFMRKLRDKMKRRHELPQPINYFPDEINDPVLGRINIPDAFPGSFVYDDQPQQEQPPDAPDVNFKYLSQLIHKMNKSEGKPAPPKRGNIVRKLPQPKKFKPTPSPKLAPKRRIGDVSDTLMAEHNDYADLGKQIADLVRKIDGKGEQQLNLDYERTETGDLPPQNLFNDNGFTSRSYWERFARSPFKISFDTERFNNWDTSEKLLSLEDQVSNTATTARSMSLQQIENMIKIMDAMKTARRKSYVRHFETHKSPENDNHSAHTKTWSNHNVLRYHQQPEKENFTNTLFKAHVDINIKKIYPLKVNVTRHENIVPRNDNQIQDRRKYNRNVAQRFKMPLSALLQNSALQKTNVAQTHKNKQNFKPKYPQMHNTIQRPHVINYDNWGPNKGIYHYENVVSSPNFSIGSLQKPSSYFHHQIHHFDFFD